MPEINYYEILGLEIGADTDQIRKAYRNAAKRFHPDMNKTSGAEELFSVIQEAYDNLIDEEKRKIHDDELQGAGYQKKGFQQQAEYQQQQAEYQQQRVYEEYYDSQQTVVDVIPKRQFNIITIIRILIAVIFLIIIPIVEFGGFSDWNRIIVYYGWLLLFYIFTEVILFLSISGISIWFIISLISNRGDQVLWAVLAFVIVIIFAWLIKPSLFNPTYLIIKE